MLYSDDGYIQYFKTYYYISILQLNILIKCFKYLVSLNVFLSTFSCLTLKHMSLIMRIPVFALCEQRCRWACALRSLISTFDVHCSDSIIPLLAKSNLSRLYLVSEAEQAGLSLTWSQTPKTGFLVTWFICDSDSLFCSCNTCSNSSAVGLFSGSLMRHNFKNSRNVLDLKTNRTIISWPHKLRTE